MAKATGWRVLGRHRWVVDALITESMNPDDSARRYVATIKGWRGWLIYEGPPFFNQGKVIMDKVIEIRNSIEAGDESIFYEKGPFINPEELTKKAKS